MSNTRFYIALAISLLLHIICIFFLSYEKIQINQKKSKALEVVYQQIKKAEQKQPLNQRDLKVVERKEEAKPYNIKILDEKREFVPSIGENLKDVSKLTGNFRLEKKRTAKMHSFDKSEKVSISMQDSEKINNPKYLSYYSFLRGKIIEKIYEAMEEDVSERGEVYVVFHLSADGMLHDVRIKADRTVASEDLKQLAMDSVRAAAPFPVFPKGLDYPEFTFKVIVYIQPN